MSSTTASKTVEVDRELVIETIAHLKAADLVFVSLNDATDSTAGDIFADAGYALKDEAFTANFTKDDSWMTDPVEVELEARASEIAADALDKLAARELEKLEEDELEKRFPPLSRIKGYRDVAKRMREQGSVDVGWRDDA
jgi:hypothetical protein